MTKIISTLKAFGHDGIAKESDSILEVLDAVSDGLSRDLFNVIVEEEKGIARLRTMLDLSSKKYYSRISKLLNAKLVIRDGIKYKPTFLGRVVYQLLLRLEVAANNRWKLMALDKIYSTNIVPVSERSRVMNDILKDPGKQEIILNPQTV